MSLTRFVCIFDLRENFVSEIDITSVDIQKLKDIFHPKDDDSNMIYVYNISEKEAVAFTRLTSIKFDFSTFLYEMTCYK